MNRIHYILFLIGVLLPNLQAQDYSINFLKGKKTVESNISTFDPQSQVTQQELFNNRFYRFVQFNSIPTEAEHQKIANAGIQLLEYIPNFVYVASIPASINQSLLNGLNIRHISPVDYTYKIGERLEMNDFPTWAMEGGYVSVVIQLYQDVNPSVARLELQKNYVSINESMDHAKILVAQLIPSQIEALVKLPFVRYVDLISEPGKPESDDGRHLHRANAIDGDYFGARNYDGTGINIAINDDGYVGPHIDFQGRLNQQNVAGDFAGNHGDGTTGCAGSAGNLDPLMRGSATGSYIHIRQYNQNLGGTIPLHQDSAVLIFNSSYSDGCNGGYTNVTVLVDQEIYNNTNLMQTFSAGNSNSNDCGYGAGNQWGNITGGHKMAKNAIATANLSETDGIVASSSRGPASDGRIKPDIAAHGSSQMSNDDNYNYQSFGGTSAAAPCIMGVMAQLHQAYKELNGGATAPSALLKVAMLATANDLGNDGPDFIYGWGKINGLKAVKVLEENRYFNGTVAQGSSNAHQITIPAGVQRAKIMVYWVDKEASTASATALINDLDATVTDPGSTVHLPWLLNHLPNATTLASPATKGADHLNNMEQIAIDNPAAGIYTLDVSGTTVPFGPQMYYVVYEFLMDEITVIHPMGGEGLIPGATDRVHWDAYGTTGTFLVEYTNNDGATWNTISAAAAGTARFVNWTVPTAITGQARVRVTRGASSDESDANFTIMQRPTNIRVNRICPAVNEIQLAWDAVPGATSYDVFVLGQKFMDSVGTASGLTFNVSVADVNDAQWFSVRAVGLNGLRSLRQIAVNYPGSAGGGPVCFLSCSGDNDAGVASLDAPGAILETCGGATTAPVNMTIENKGLFTETNFPVYYQFGANPVVMETYTGNLTAGGTANFAFATPITIPVAGAYQLKIWTGLATDSTICNDTIIQTVNVLDPQGSFPYSEDFDGGIFPPPSSYIINSDNDQTWRTASVTGAAGTPTTAMYIDNFSYDAAGQEDVFSLVTMDMTQAIGATAMVTFDVAYRAYNGTFFDGLRVDLSTDCGQTFNQVYLKSGTVLATGTNTTNNFVPTSAANWRNDTIDLNAYVGSNVVLRFVNICGYGNNLYVDNINVNVIGALAPVANFTADIFYTCDGTIKFTDQSGNQPVQWLWAFGDGGVSTVQNPTYTYPVSGTYTVSLQATNTTGVDSEVKNAYIIVEYPEVTSVNNGAGCPNTSIELSASNTNGNLHWYNGAGTLVHVGDTFNTPSLVATTNYQVQNIILTPKLNVGPLNGTVGGGGYHGNTFTGGTNFTTYTDFELISVWVDANGAGPRTITLWDGNVAVGTNPPTNPVVATATVNLVDGPQRVFLNFQVPSAGNYCIGAANANMYRNNAGISYPYTIPNVVSLTSSTATTPATFFYYLYDWELRLDSCAGTISTVTAAIVEPNFSAGVSGGTAAFSDLSTGATSWAWNFGDGTTSTLQNPMHTYTSNGPHLVTLSINNGACSFMDSVSVSVGIEEISHDMRLVILPNPATSETTLRFSEVLPTDLAIEVIGVDGKVLITSKMLAGQSNKTLDLSILSPAMYLVRLKTDTVVEVRKIVVVR